MAKRLSSSAGPSGPHLSHEGRGPAAEGPGSRAGDPREVSEWRDVLLDQLVTMTSGKPIKPGLAGKYNAFGSNGIIGRAPQARHERGLIVGRVGAYCGSVAMSEAPFWASDNTIVLEPRNEGDLRYLYYLLLDAKLNRHAGGAAQPLITQTTLKGLTYRVPPEPLRMKIGDILRSFDAIIENNRRRIALLEQMAQAIYREWFTFLRYPGHEDEELVDSRLGRIPAGWHVRTLGELAVFSAGNGLTKASYVEDGYLAFSAAGPDGFLETYDVEGDGVVLSAVGARCGRTWRATGCWSSISNTIRYQPSSGVGAEWLYLATVDPHVWPRRGAAQPFISINDARGVQVVAPDVGLLQQFGDRTRPLFNEVDTLDASINRLSKARDMLLPRLVTGSIDVTSLDLDGLLEESAA
jgi:type I restriction enzyme S subunit